MLAEKKDEEELFPQNAAQQSPQPEWRVETAKASWDEASPSWEAHTYIVGVLLQWQLNVFPVSEQSLPLKRGKKSSSITLTKSYVETYLRMSLVCFDSRFLASELQILNT